MPHRTGSRQYRGRKAREKTLPDVTLADGAPRYLRRAAFCITLKVAVEIRYVSKYQRHRASGLNLLVAAIILWNTTYLQRAVDHLHNQGHHPASGDLAHLSPLGWEHINLTGDYHWDTSPTLGPDEFRPLRTHAHDFAAAA